MLDHSRTGMSAFHTGILIQNMLTYHGTKGERWRGVLGDRDDIKVYFYGPLFYSTSSLTFAYSKKLEDIKVQRDKRDYNHKMWMGQRDRSTRISTDGRWRGMERGKGKEWKEKIP
ncbi:hypothetical protein BHE74_00021914 [Ensete ventricosum]|nr:hypothetical protein GW17_00011186 [Ensete ventricosum]RWW70408.1 hypothetical protein BHE74_00021914 [Ensete ventricosum]